jgi:hypothetical protein
MPALIMATGTAALNIVFWTALASRASLALPTVMIAILGSIAAMWVLRRWFMDNVGRVPEPDSGIPPEVRV